MICKNCRQEIENDSLYCKYCGRYTGRYPRTQSPAFLKRVIAWLLVLVSLLSISSVILGVMSISPKSDKSSSGLMAKTGDSASPTPTPTDAPPKRGEKVTDKYSVQDKKKLNMYLSVFTCSEISSFSQEGGEADVADMLKCAFIYCKRNKKSSVVTDGNKQYISRELMHNTADELFGVQLEATSEGEFTYESKRYYTSAKLLPDTSFAQTTAIYKNNDGTHTIELDIYDYGSAEFSSEFYNPKSEWTEGFVVNLATRAEAVVSGLGSDKLVIVSYEETGE